MIELKIGQLNTDNAQNGNVLTYVAANGVVEYRDIVGEIDARIIANVNTVQNNVTALDNNAWVNANDFATYITVTTNTYNTYASLIAYVDGELSNLVSGAPATLDTLNELAAALGNDANLSVTLTGMIGNVAANAATNATNINTVQENVASLDTTVTANTYNTYTTLTANTYNTYNTLNGRINTVQDNIAASSNNAWVNANDFATYSTVTANIYNTYTTLSSQISASGGISNVVIGGTDLSNSSIAIVAGNGVSISVNATTSVATFTTSMSNVTSEIIEIDGSANVFSLAKAAYNTHMVLVSYNGLLQDPRRYELTNNAGGSYLTINNTSPLIADSNLEVRYFDFFSLPGVSESAGGGGYTFQGSTSGYMSGGLNPSNQLSNVIDKFSFTSDGNATDVGDQSLTRERAAGQSSSESGYTSGGYRWTPYVPLNTIDKFSFSADGNATDVGDLTVARQFVVGQSSSTSGYTSGGYNATLSPGVKYNIIDKFPFSTDSNAADVGDLTQSRQSSSGQSSTTHGYTTGGSTGSGVSNVIDKFSFAVDGNASDVGDLSVAGRYGFGQSSTTSGYNSSSYNPTSNVIDKFPFATDSNSTNVGSLSVGRGHGAGQSSTTSGYSSGGDANGAPTYFNIIDKFPFASDGTATDVGDLTVARTRTAAGQQV
jgi:hypothetical protein